MPSFTLTNCYHYTMAHFNLLATFYGAVGMWWGLCALRNAIQNSTEAILACHPALSTAWLGWVANSCKLWHIRTDHIEVLEHLLKALLCHQLTSIKLNFTVHVIYMKLPKDNPLNLASSSFDLCSEEKWKREKRILSLSQLLGQLLSRVDRSLRI